MPTFHQVFYESPNGLLPFLFTVLNRDFTNFQVRRYAGAGLTQGFRPLNDDVDTWQKQGRDRLIRQTVALGLTANIPYQNPDTGVSDAIALRDSVDDAILAWASRKVQLVAGEVDRISGPGLEFRQPARTSQIWQVVIVRTFTVPYLRQA